MSKKNQSKHRLDHNAFIVTPGKKIRLKDFDTAYTAGIKDKKQGREVLLEDVSDLAKAQSLLWANAKNSLLIVLQAMDAAGKDGAIKHVMSGVNPQGVDVYSFKAPTTEELLHHFLWRPMVKVPARSRIAIFNRSYYEEVLVVRVHPEFLEKQYLPSRERNASGCLKDLWGIRYEKINQFEEVTAHNDVTIIKFFLNVSKEEQRERFVERLNNAEKN